MYYFNSKKSLQVLVFILIAVLITVITIAYFLISGNWQGENNSSPSDFSDGVSNIPSAVASAPSIDESDDTSSNISDLSMDESDVSVDDGSDSSFIEYSKPPITDDPEKSYESLYPDLYALYEYTPTPNEKKTIYLTFDDGPSATYTAQILDVLKEYNIKATFFVVGVNIKSRTIPVLQRIVEEGHQIGIHTYSHVYKEIYASVEDYLNDFYKVYQKLYESTGIRAEIFRFPGGSINSYNRDVYKPIIAEMTRRGFAYFDWNVDSGDTYKSPTTESLIENTLKDVTRHSTSVILMHDARSITAASIREVIESLLDLGYEFDVITKNTPSIVFGSKK